MLAKASMALVVAALGLPSVAPASTCGFGLEATNSTFRYPEVSEVTSPDRVMAAFELSCEPSDRKGR